MSTAIATALLSSIAAALVRAFLAVRGTSGLDLGPWFFYSVMQCLLYLATFVPLALFAKSIAPTSLIIQTAIFSSLSTVPTLVTLYGYYSSLSFLANGGIVLVEKGRLTDAGAQQVFEDVIAMAVIALVAALIFYVIGRSRENAVEGANRAGD